uniref:beta-1 adrenergic receptor-like n=1 Tax=Myxine glutinosa TaxID=7769 RepID=UPI00359001AF
MNASKVDVERMDDPWTIALGVFLSVVALLTVGGNILVLVAVGTSHLMQGVTNSFVTSLAWTDLLTGALVMPPNIAKIITGAWIFGPTICVLWNIVDIICGVASIETLCVIAIDRYVAITSPLRYKELMTPLRARLLIGGVWLLSTAISVIPIMLGWFKSDDPAAQACYADPDCCEYVSGKLYTAISSVIVFYMPLSIMVFVYSRVLKEAERQVDELDRRQEQADLILVQVRIHI